MSAREDRFIAACLQGLCSLADATKWDTGALANRAIHIARHAVTMTPQPELNRVYGKDDPQDPSHPEHASVVQVESIRDRCVDLARVIVRHREQAIMTIRAVEVRLLASEYLRLVGEKS